MSDLRRKLKKRAGEERGAAVVEVSFIIPLMIFLMGGILYFAIFMVDMSKVKGEVISQAVCEAQSKKEQTMVTVEKEIHLQQPFPGLSDYMSSSYDFRGQASALVDRRKELKWIKE